MLRGSNALMHYAYLLSVVKAEEYRKHNIEEYPIAFRILYITSSHLIHYAQRRQIRILRRQNDVFPTPDLAQRNAAVGSPGFARQPLPFVESMSIRAKVACHKHLLNTSIFSYLVTYLSLMIILVARGTLICSFWSELKPRRSVNQVSPCDLRVKFGKMCQNKVIGHVVGNE